MTSNNIKSSNHPFSSEISDLYQRHFEDHIKGSGISVEVGKERGYKTVQGKKELEQLGFSKTQGIPPGLLLPVFTPDEKNPFCTYRPDMPRIDSKGKVIKYEMPKGIQVRIDVPRRCIQDLKNPQIRLWITEGQKKADALASHNECVIDFLGVWNFKGKNEYGGTTLLADLDYIAWDNRDVYIAFDSDVMIKEQVRQALDRITEHLKRKGAKLFHVYLPNDDNNKVGVDDFLLKHDVDALFSLTKKPEDTKNEEKNQKTIYSARFEGLIEIVVFDGIPRFLVLEDGKGILKTEINKNGEKLIPPPKDKLPWILPRAVEVKKYFDNDTPEKLFNNLITYFKSISELPNEKYYILITAWVFHTYLMEGWNYTPILCFFAVAERGKSRTGKAIVFVAYRGRHTETLREANVFRASESQGATLFFDCINIWKKLEKQGAEDILLLRFEKGAKAERVLYPERGAFQDTVYYDIFGPTIIATNEPVYKVLDSRCIPIIMQQSHENFSVDPSPQLGLPFRERLTAWRAKTLAKDIKLADKPTKGRLGDILQPLATIVELVVPDKKDEFKQLVETLEEDRLQEKTMSIESDVIQAITECEDYVENGTLAISKIVENVNADRAEKEKLTPQRIGRVIKSLGIKSAKKHGGVKAIFYDENQINNLQDSYGLTPYPEQTSPMSPRYPDDTQHTENIEENSGDLLDTFERKVTTKVSTLTSPNHCKNEGDGDDGDLGDLSIAKRERDKETEKEADPWD
ncbi:DUF3854 domain-containing protein [Desulfobacterota bacterium AH_259_B03_O07]|nr:DUF3854 domain-containing protein [Desulfobacterota bacterium AH_259_B03_O07]